MLLYLDSSVIGGCFDEEFRFPSERLIEWVRLGLHEAIVSEVVLAEIQRAPDQVKNLLSQMLAWGVKVVPLSTETIILRQAYMEAGVLGDRWVDDATHAAMATICRADALVSWNFKHLVRLDKIRSFNEVNLRLNYGFLQIVSPLEIGHDD